MTASSFHIPSIGSWRAVKTKSGRYEVSEYGDVRNVETHRVLRPFLTASGYHIVKLGNVGLTKNYRVHRLVAEAFLGEPNISSLTVNHIDFCKTNNHFSNLEWCSHQENIRHYVRGVARGERKRDIPLLDDSRVQQILEMLNSRAPLSDRKLGLRFGVSRRAIQDIRLAKTWRHLTCGVAT